MKKRKYTAFLRCFAVILNLLAAAALTIGLASGARSGYGREVWEDVLRGREYLETGQYASQASEAVYNALSVAAKSSRLEKGGAYDPDKIIRVRDYLDSRTVYETMPESEKSNGICYRLGDLYQWSLKGTSFGSDVLYEPYKPLFYGSIQEYANECDEEYNVVVSQIQEVMNMLQKDVAEYQELKKAWSYEAVNVRYALWDLGNGNIITNVPELQHEGAVQEDFEAYFKNLGSYYIFDSRSTNVAQQNVGDYYSYNTHSLLSGWNIHLTGEYQVYVGIDTGFPVADEMAVSAREYEKAQEVLPGYIGPVVTGGVILLITALYLLWRLAEYTGRALLLVMEHANTVVRLCLCFAGYELIGAVLRLILGTGLIGDVVLLGYKLAVLGILIWEALQRQRLLDGVLAMTNGEQDARISTEGLFQNNMQMAEAVNNLGDGLKSALQEQMKSERMKADLITNVSHDLKTPLTSIINYVDLMKREKIDHPKAQEYLRVLDQKSQRLKQLTEDLVEASRASSGNVTLDIQRIDFKELLMQTSGEFEERFAARGLKLMSGYPDYPLYVEADGRRLWRIIENLYRNVEKYAMPNTRVYLDVKCDGQMAVLSMKNVSEQPLNITAEELTERFTRGDESRTTEGSGLGLAIAKDLTELQNGTFDIYLDGDLFKVTVAFPWAAGGELI
ncbi:MAG: HAMP domain-containing histidine kinase [Clostridiales bacterium]|nr:HAMP domain-containing histidine kinase [Clostridiales bacterium]